jgi:hypothetical protein
MCLHTCPSILVRMRLPTWVLSLPLDMPASQLSNLSIDSISVDWGCETVAQWNNGRATCRRNCAYLWPWRFPKWLPGSSCSCPPNGFLSFELQCVIICRCPCPLPLLSLVSLLRASRARSPSRQPGRSPRAPPGGGRAVRRQFGQRATGIGQHAARSTHKGRQKK